MNPQRALIEAAEMLLEEHCCDDGSVDYKGTESECAVCIKARAAISSAKAAEEADGSLKAAERDTLLNWYKDRAERAESKLRGLEAKTAGSSEVREKEELDGN